MASIEMLDRVIIMNPVLLSALLIQTPCFTEWLASWHE